MLLMPLKTMCQAAHNSPSVQKNPDDFLDAAFAFFLVAAFLGAAFLAVAFLGDEAFFAAWLCEAFAGAAAVAEVSKKPGEVGLPDAAGLVAAVDTALGRVANSAPTALSKKPFEAPARQDSNIQSCR